MKESVTVIGGGIAGLSASVFLAQEGFTVGLYESSPRFGGRTYSFYDDQFGGYIDNGQHILASWYTNTFEYLKIIGSYNKLHFQTRLEVNFRNRNAEEFILKAAKLPPPFHLLKGLMGFKVLNLNDRVAAIKLINLLKTGKINENTLRELNTNELFNNYEQTDKLIENFWKPFIIAVFNSQPENTSAYMFAEIIRTGFLERGGSNLVFPDVFLSDLLVEPAVKFLEKNNGTVKTNSKVDKFNINNNKLSSIIIKDKSEIKSNYYISAVPFYSFYNLMNGYELLSGKEGLFPSPIVNIHLKFAEDVSWIIKNRFYGILDQAIQWVFRVKNDQVCLVISSAKEIAEMEKNNILHLCRNELYSAFPELKQINIIGERVIKEMRATFIPDKESLKNRPGCKTKLDNLFLAGDWTNTGLPATIEGAVKSARICVDEILKNISSN